MDLRCLRILYGLFALTDTLMSVVDETRVIFCTQYGFLAINNYLMTAPFAIRWDL